MFEKHGKVSASFLAKKKGRNNGGIFKANFQLERPAQLKNYFACGKCLFIP